MTDFLLEIGARPHARRLVRSLGLPLPIPEALRRSTGSWSVRPLADRAVLFVAGALPELAAQIAEALAHAGADPRYVDASFAEVFRGPGEAHGRPASPLRAEGETLAGLVLDASGIDSVAGLRVLVEGVQPHLAKLDRSARVVLVGREPDDAMSAIRAATQAALEGFAKSLAKELGGRGITVNVVRVSRGAEDRLAGPLVYLLTDRSAFVTGQAIVVDARAQGAVVRSRTRPLEGKVALVTGAARGIGAATARALAVDGAKVICLDRPDDDEVASALARSIDGELLLLDVTAADAPARIAELVARRGGLDVLVHNAGITRDKTLARMATAQWDAVLHVNLDAVVRITDALVPHLRPGARIVCLSSIAGLAGNMGQTAYAASKAAIVGYVRALAARITVPGATVNAIAPGFIETRLTAAIPVAIREVARRLSALGQGGRPEDVADAISFLARPDSLGVHGRTLRVCGGAFVGA